MWEKQILSETSIIWGSLPAQSLVNNQKITHNIIRCYVNYKPNRFGDIKLDYLQDQQWVIDFVREHYKVEYGFTLIAISQYCKIDKPHERSVKRHHLDYYNLSNSPDFSLLYFVKGKGNLIIEWNDHRHKHGYWTIPIEAGKYVLFNSDLNYYLEESPTNELRMYLNFNCQIK